MTVKEKNVAEEVYDNPIFEIFGFSFKNWSKKLFYFKIRQVLEHLHFYHVYNMQILKWLC